MAEKRPQYSGVLIILMTICVAAIAVSLYSYGMLARFEVFVLDHRLLAARLPSIDLLRKIKLPRGIELDGSLQGKEVSKKLPKCSVILIDIPESGTGSAGEISLKACAITAKILTIWGAGSIVFTDLLSEQTGGAAEAELVEVVASSKSIYLPAFYYTGDKYWKNGYTGEPAKRVQGPWQALLSPAVSVGHINAFPYIDGRLRRVPVFMEYNGDRIYQLGIQAVMDVMGVKASGVEFDPEAHTLVLNTLRGERIAVPLEKDNQLTIKWALRDGSRLKRIPFRDILESYRMIQYGARPIIDPDIFKGSICILGTAESNAVSAKPPLVKEGLATSAASGFIASSLLNEDFVYRPPKALNIAIILAVTLLFGLALVSFKALRFMIVIVVAITLFGLASVLQVPQNIILIIVLVLAVPLGIFIANSQVFSGLIFAVLSIIGYHMVAIGIFNTSGLVIPVFFPILAMIVTFTLFYTYARFKEYLDKRRFFDLASKDGLTGLTNRRYLNLLLDAELSSAALDKSRKLSIVMCDIDNFKKLNDTHGHQAGDVVLKGCANIMKLKCRRSDVVARYGGEEFVIILLGSSAKSSMIVADGIRQAIAEEKFIFKGNLYSTSISMGLAEYSNEITKEELIEKADQALYRAKSEGKNRVCQ